MRPVSIVRFERVFWAWWIVGVIDTVASWGENLSYLQRTVPQASDALPMLLGGQAVVLMGAAALLGWLTAQRGSGIARWLVLAMALIGVAVHAAAVVKGAIPGGWRAAIWAVQFALLVAMIWFLLRPDAADWFAGEDEPETSDDIA
jgi:hypothetical protein